MEAEAKAKAEAEEKARLEAEAKAKAEAEEKARLEAEAKAKAEAEEKARLEEEAKAKAEAQAKLNSFVWRAEKDGDGFNMTGQAPDPWAKLTLQIASNKEDRPDLEISEHAPEGFLQNALAALKALENADAGSVAFENGKWQIELDASDFDQQDAIKEALSVANIGTKPTINAPAARDICQDTVAGLVAANPIVFQSGSARIDAGSKQTISQIAAQLVRCPSVVLEVEGHTDADGPANDNLTLSVMRAESVVDELIELGVSPTRLFAVGYGETLPVASNDTRKGKALNRRIVFTVREHSE